MTADEDDDELCERWRDDVVDRLEQAWSVAGMAKDRGVVEAGGWIAAVEAALELVRYGR